ncbi:MAG: phosphoenolpyruvate synthase [Candidatus Parvarchaeota archaeon]|nr:phosphoenolpyruvate synthase [Candidatus Parvarchaeota archaeon]
MERKKELVLWFNEIGKNDVSLVGGKSANLGEMVSTMKVPVPNGFSTTAYAFDEFIRINNLEDKINEILNGINEEDSNQLGAASKKIKELVVGANLQEELVKKVSEYYTKLIDKEKEDFVAIRSSATSEDLPDASFAGQQDTYLNIKGIEDVLEKIKECYASLFTARAIYYRIKKGFGKAKISLAVAVQRQVFSETAGVIFTLDVSNGDNSVVMVEASYGLGEFIVQGTVTPDTYYVDKKTKKIKKKIISRTKTRMLVREESGGTKELAVPKDKVEVQCLTDNQIIELASYGIEIEKHYGRPMDMEWAQDNRDHKLFIVQARSETVWSNKKNQIAQKEKKDLNSMEIIVKGLSASPGTASGIAHILNSEKEIDSFKEGEILITKMTAPDWVPAMKKAKAIVTNEGGMTCHAAIVSREMGVPCIVGTGSISRNATEVIKDGAIITVDATNGIVYAGKIADEPHGQDKGRDVEKVGEIITGTKIMVNLGEPDLAEKVAALPVDGVGLMREEFLWAQIGEHPLSLIKKGKSQFVIDTLSEGIKKVCSAFNPRPVIMRFSDFKSDEYTNLKGGEEFEPKEEAPLLGWRGASRYYDSKYKDAFVLELKAVKKVREEMGFKNLWVMIPFTRTVDELKKVLGIMKENGLERGEDLKIFLMAEIPSNIILADRFNEFIDGYSIGSNDLTMLTLGADRDSALMSSRFDERDLAVKRLIRYLIKIAHKDNKTVSICGQAPSKYDEIVDFLVRSDIDDISVNPDVAVHVRELVASVEKRIEVEAATKDKVDHKEWEFPL